MSNSDPRATWSSRDAPSALPPEIAATAVPVPEAEDRYEETGVELGRGGMGRVVLRLDRALGREVAIKEMLGGASVSGGARARFLREARVTAALEHPNIVPIHELGERPDGTLYYTMRRVQGQTLADAIHERPWRTERMALLKHVIDAAHAVA